MGEYRVILVIESMESKRPSDVYEGGVAVGFRSKRVGALSRAGQNERARNEMKRLMAASMLASFLLVACDDSGSSGSRYDGVYELTVHQSKSNCEADTWTDEEITDPYFRLDAQSFFGEDIIAWSDCTGPNLGTCEDSMSFTESFVWKDGVWQQHMTMSYFSQGECTLSYRSAVLEETETGIQWEAVVKAGKVAVPTEDDCEPELAEEREDELTCESIDFYQAVRLD